MEQNEIREQPKIQPLQTGEVENTKDMAKELETGSLGKFKDADALMTAYTNLQAEFTRKCQRLAELEKNTEQLQNPNQSDAGERTPLYKRENWSEIVAKFLSSNAEARQYSKEICNEIMENKDIYTDEKSLENAFLVVKDRHMKNPETIAKDSEFINNYILTSEEIKSKVMKIYLDELKSNCPPKVMTTSSGGSIIVAKDPTPKSLKEAKALVRKLIEN